MSENTKFQAGRIAATDLLRKGLNLAAILSIQLRQERSSGDGRDLAASYGRQSKAARKLAEELDLAHTYAEDGDGISAVRAAIDGINLFAAQVLQVSAHAPTSPRIGFSDDTAPLIVDYFGENLKFDTIGEHAAHAAAREAISRTKYETHTSQDAATVFDEGITDAILYLEMLRAKAKAGALPEILDAV